jgi:hypothetical protein
MDELIKLVSKKAGIPADQARKAVDAVIGFLKKKLPAPVFSQVEGLLSGGGLTAAADKAQGLAKGLGGLLGRKK